MCDKVWEREEESKLIKNNNTHFMVVRMCLHKIALHHFHDEFREPQRKPKTWRLPVCLLV